MARKKTRSRSEVQYTFLTIRMDRFGVRVRASVNYYVEQPQYAVGVLDDKDAVFEFVTCLDLYGTATHPPERIGETFEIKVCGEDGMSRSVNLTLGDVHTRNECGSPQYREYRGKQVPIFKPVLGFGPLNKGDGPKSWRAWINLAPRSVSDMLTLLGRGQSLFIALHERKEQRQRWVRGLTLQTADPTDE